MPSWYCYFCLEINHLVHIILYLISERSLSLFHLCRPVTLASASALLHPVQHLPSCRSQSCLEKTCRYDSRQSSATDCQWYYAGTTYSYFWYRIVDSAFSIHAGQLISHQPFHILFNTCQVTVPIFALRRPADTLCADLSPSTSCSTPTKSPFPFCLEKTCRYVVSGLEAVIWYVLSFSAQKCALSDVMSSFLYKQLNNMFFSIVSYFQMPNKPTTAKLKSTTHKAPSHRVSTRAAALVAAP